MGDDNPAAFFCAYVKCYRTLPSLVVAKKCSIDYIIGHYI